MGLDKIFEKAEKPTEEKKLEVVASGESILNEWLIFFNKYLLGCSEELLSEKFNDWKLYLESYNQLTPGMISKFSERIDLPKRCATEIDFSGFFVSFMIHKSYNQGFNNFEFGEVKLPGLCSHLRGKRRNPIKVKAQIVNAEKFLTFSKYCDLEAGVMNGRLHFMRDDNCKIIAQHIIGNDLLFRARYSSLEVETINGHSALAQTYNCSLKTKKIVGYSTAEFSKKCNLEAEVIEGDYALNRADGCIAKIGGYKGEEFGYRIKNCKIYVHNKEALEIMKKQAERGKKNFFRFF
ncbi:hypothetical protein HY643_02165 [Candidatus Woesearchaeota archaeon]|nr:hypothetical protein [Candidatus Woesearchaeota archaeon]